MDFSAPVEICTSICQIFDSHFLKNRTGISSQDALCGARFYHLSPDTARKEEGQGDEVDALLVQ
jgi:hypothetical protein